MSEPCEAEAAELALREAQWIIAKANELIAAAAVLVATEAYETCLLEHAGGGEDPPPPEPELMQAEEPATGQTEIKRLRNVAHDICCMEPHQRAQQVDRAMQLKKRLVMLAG